MSSLCEHGAQETKEDWIGMYGKGQNYDADRLPEAKSTYFIRNA